MKKNDEMKKDAEIFFIEGIKAADSFTIVREAVTVKENFLIIKDVYGNEKNIDLKSINKIFIIGAGKASANMAKAAEKILNEKIHKGIIVTKYGFAEDLNLLKVIEAGHPLPDENSIKAAKEIYSICENAGENDLIINLLSGGASALLSLPIDELTLKDITGVTKLLLNCGASIDELNCIRKHFSKVKGGRLAKAASPAKIVSLILSDVIGDRLDTVGSGPTVPDTSSLEDVNKIFEKYNLYEKLPENIKTLLKENKVEETPKKNEEYFNHVFNLLIGNNKKSIAAVKKNAEGKNYNVKILSYEVEGEAKEVGKNFAEKAKKYSNGKEGNFCLIAGGETTVKVTGSGTGGRNLELCLSAAKEINGIDGIIFLSGGTDGNDGPTDAAGAIIDGNTIIKGRENNLNADEYLKNNDSYNYFKKLDQLLITGPTKTNVMDLQIILISK